MGKKCCCPAKGCNCKTCSDVRCLLRLGAPGVNPDDVLLLQLTISGIALVTAGLPCRPCEDYNLTFPLHFFQEAAYGLYQFLAPDLPLPDRKTDGSDEGCTWASDDILNCSDSGKTSTLQAAASLYKNNAGGVSWYTRVSFSESSPSDAPFTNQIIWEQYGAISGSADGKVKCKELDTSLTTYKAFELASAVFCDGPPTVRLQGMAA